MTQIRMPLTTKLFVAIGMTAFLVIAVMAALVAASMREGFSQYLLQGELVGLENLIDVLAEQHDPDQPGWPEFQESPEAWRPFVETQFRPSHSIRPGAPPRGPGGAPPIGERLVLLNETGQQIAGTALATDQFQRRPISAPQLGNSEGKVIGWLGLYAPPGARNVIDAFFLRGQLKSLIVASLVALAISAVAAYLLAKQFLAPIHALESGAKILARGEYGARIPNRRSDELGQLIDHYNDLATSLEAAEIAEQQWVSDTSHELQTPLSVLRAQIEAVQDGVRPANEKTLASMHAAVLRLTRLVADLRTLARGREDGFGNIAALENVGDILQDSADASRLAESGLDLIVRIEPSLMAICDGQRVRQVIDNLLENTLRYTDQPGQVVLTAWADETSVQINLADSGPAPPTETLPLLFDRFYRGEASRSRALGGSGLGLSICKTIIEAHGGSIAANPSDMGGLAIHLTLPIKGQSA